MRISENERGRDGGRRRGGEGDDLFLVIDTTLVR